MPVVRARAGEWCDPRARSGRGSVRRRVLVRWSRARRGGRRRGAVLVSAAGCLEDVEFVVDVVGGSSRLC